jgi:hypothetical protein
MDDARAQSWAAAEIRSKTGVQTSDPKPGAMLPLLSVIRAVIRVRQSSRPFWPTLITDKSCDKGPTYRLACSVTVRTRSLVVPVLSTKRSISNLRRWRGTVASDTPIASAYSRFVARGCASK